VSIITLNTLVYTNGEAPPYFLKHIIRNVRFGFLFSAHSSSLVGCQTLCFLGIPKEKSQQQRSLVSGEARAHHHNEKSIVAETTHEAQPWKFSLCER
jgi:hypothetical protein